MCGIFGQYSWARPPDDPALLWSATESLAHRGPDGGAFWSEGAFFFGHRRLSIIDLAEGAQPMASVDGRYVVTFNGEIYNYIELRQELEGRGHRFRTQSDTEVLLAGYAEWGSELPKHLLGMFAFAIADRRDEELFIARDRFGEKPLFIRETAGRITFASELKALSSLPDADREIDVAGLSAYLCLNYVPGDATMLRDVRRLPAGSWRRYRRGTQERGQFWSALDSNPAGPLPQTLDEAADAASTAIDASVRMALRSDVPVALFLSGGIDSSLVAESAVRQGGLKEAFCVDFADSGFSEWDGAKRVADKLGVRLHRVRVDSAMLSDFESVVAHADDPLADSSSLPVYSLARETARQFKVTISGDGGDELFGGYLTHRATRMHASVIARLPIFLRRAMAGIAPLLPVTRGKATSSYMLRRFLRAADLESSAAHFSWNGTWLPHEARGFVASDLAGEDMLRCLDRVAGDNGLTGAISLAALQRADIREYLANDILVKVDRMTMAHGLESRAPLLSPELASFGLALPEHLKVGRGGGKLVLRRLASKMLGTEVGQARKQGFSIPIHDWLSGPGRELLLDKLSPASIAATRLLDTAAVVAVRDAHLQGEASYGFELWGLMVLVEWCRVRRDAPPFKPADPAALARHQVLRGAA